MDIPPLAVVGNYAHALFVVPSEESSDLRMSSRMKPHSFSNPELHHGRMRSHIAEKAQAGNDPMIQVDQFFFGESVNVDSHLGLSPPEISVGWKHPSTRATSGSRPLSMKFQATLWKTQDGRLAHPAMAAMRSERVQVLAALARAG